MFERLNNEAVAIIDGIIGLCYWMRGSMSYEELMRRTPGERQRINAFLEHRLEQESKSPFPNY